MRHQQKIEHRRVALSNPEDEYHNTIVTGGAHIVIPLAVDLDNDPLQDDEVKLYCADGSYEQTLLANDASRVVPDVDHNLVDYHFFGVPYGLYRVAVRVGATWIDVSEVIVCRRGLFINGKKIEEDTEPVTAEPTPAGEDENVPPEFHASDDEDFIPDQNPDQDAYGD